MTSISPKAILKILFIICHKRRCENVRSELSVSYVMFQSIKFVRHVIFKVILKENPAEKDDENEEAEKRRYAGFRPLEKKRKPLNFPKATLRFPPFFG